MEFKKLDVEQSQLVVVDVQEKMIPHVSNPDQTIRQICRIVQAARLLNLPVTLTEQYPEGLGHTHAAVRDAAGDAPVFVKSTFSFWADQATREHLTEPRRPQMILVGVETHICIQQSAIDLTREKFRPTVLLDATSSRREVDRDIGVARMRGLEIDVSTVEAAIFEMMVRSDTELFKAMLPVVK